MIQSMTGFGAAERNGFRVEIRSLNHRFLDMTIKLNPLLSWHEMPLRNMMKERFSRGKLDASVSITNDGKTRFKINTGLAQEIYQSLNNLKKELSAPGDIGIETLLNYRELFIAEEPEVDAGLLYETFKEAMAQLERMRIDEGKAMAEDVLKRADMLEAMRKELLALIPDVISDCRKRLHDRFKELLGAAELDSERIVQEVALLAEKTDITEEITRIENHLRQFRKILSTGDTIGKRLDFLLQELNREANTIASKTSDLRVSNIAVEMKSEIEKMREQVQNIQ